MKRFHNYRNEEIQLSKQSWDHICEAHPEISEAMISECLNQPNEVRRSTTKTKSELYYLLRFHQRYTCVVVKRCPDGDFIATAMTVNKPKFGELIYTGK